MLNVEVHATPCRMANTLPGTSKYANNTAVSVSLGDRFFTGINYSTYHIHVRLYWVFQPGFDDALCFIQYPLSPAE